MTIVTLILLAWFSSCESHTLFCNLMNIPSIHNGYHPAPTGQQPFEYPYPQPLPVTAYGQQNDMLYNNIPKFANPMLDRVCTPVSAAGSLTSSPTIPSPHSSPRSPSSRGTDDNANQFSDYRLDPLLKRRCSDDDDDDVDEASLDCRRSPKRVCSADEKKSNSTRAFSQLDMLSYISERTTNKTPEFLRSEHTYTIYQPLAAPIISTLLEQNYGGRVVVSRKRKPLEVDYESQVTTPAVKRAKQAQGRPYSGEMVIDLIFPKTVDELYNFLCTKSNPPLAHRVKLQNHVPPGRRNGQSGIPIFDNSQSMVKYFTGSNEFSIITAFRQSSMDRSAFKKGTCPVVKFNISPVTDYSIEYLKRMAYPRYKACMKIYLFPQVFKDAYTFYTSGAMYLQDQQMRLENGVPMDLRSRIFHSKSWPDLPNSVYDREFSDAETKTKLNYILN